MKRLTALFTTLGLMASTMVAFAEPGIQTGWFFQQLSLLILVVAVALFALFFAQKQTSKAVITIVTGSVLYIIAKAPEGAFTAIGNLIKRLFGIG